MNADARAHFDEVWNTDVLLLLLYLLLLLLWDYCIQICSKKHTFSFDFLFDFRVKTFLQAYCRMIHSLTTSGCR